MRANPAHGLRVLPLLLALAASGTAWALSTDKDQPADIQARNVDADERAETARYRDRVRYSQGTRRIDADRLDVVMKDDEVEDAKAWGQPVRVRLRPDNSKHDAHASGARLEYRREGDTLELFDTVVLTHRPDDKDDDIRASGDRLFYRAGEDVAELFGRVVVQQGGDVMSGGYARFDLKSDRLVMRGGEHTDDRVHAVIQPSREKKKAKP